MSTNERVKKWAQQVVELNGLDVAPPFRKRKAKLMKSAKIIKESLEATDPLRPLASVIQNELGFLPAIAAAGMIGTIVYRWAKKVTGLALDDEKYKALVTSGVKPEKALEIVTGKTTSLGWKTIVIPAAILTGGFITYKLMRK